MNALIYVLQIALFLPVTASQAPVELTDSTFGAAVAEKPHFVKFYAPWCGHCQRLAPTWDELAAKYNIEDRKMTIAKVDCVQHTATCSQQGVQGYPTLKYVHKSEEKKYQGQRSLDSLSAFVEDMLGHVTDEKEEKIRAAGEPKIEKGLAELNADNFDGFTEAGIHFVKFYAPWCGHCQRLAPTWSDLAQRFESNDLVHINKVDCTQNRDLCSKHSVRGYPTLLLFRDGKNLEKYQGSRDVDSFITFIEKFAKVPEVQEEREVKDEEIVFDSSEVTGEEGDEATTERPPSSDSVVVLTGETFDSAIGDGLVFVKFYAPWCGHCKRLAPVYEDLGRVMADEHVPVTIAEIDCTAHGDICEKNHVHGYPTLILYKNGKKLKEHTGSRVLEDLITFVTDYVTAE